MTDDLMDILIPLIIALIAVALTHVLISYRDYIRLRNGFITEFEENYDNYLFYRESETPTLMTLFSNSAFLEFRNKGYLLNIDSGVKSELNAIYLYLESLNHIIINYQISISDDRIKKSLKSEFLSFVENLDFFDFPGNLEYLQKLSYWDII
ncbi:MAG: hypothetical protein APR54_01520 [Candidatus Cloacimonas sp. SDB]|nr:MAG: hypothetical protein APR54_01520 [Candidatus Cloacimonas sp. SDB]